MSVRIPRAGRRNRRLASLLVAVTCVACGGSGYEPEPRQPGTTWSPENTAPSVRYVGADACSPCHLGVHATYTRTGMARSYGPPPETAVSTGERPTFRIGSGNHVTQLFGERDDRRSALDLCRYAGQDKWTSCPPGAPGDIHLSSGAIDECLFCHGASLPPPRGVDCERCHGPGELHVARWKGSADTGRGVADPTIVNPRRLGTDRRLAVCLQCHLDDSGGTARVPRLGTRVESFRPGEPLTDVLIPFHRVPALPLRFGAASQGDRLMLSRCFRESDGGLDCLTCHNPHVSVYHEERPPDLFRLACLRCHDATACKAAPSSRRATVPEDDCVACHMRKAEPDDLRLTRYTDHWIRRRIDADEGQASTPPIVEPLWPESLEGLEAGQAFYYRAKAYAMLAQASRGAERDELRNRALNEIDLAVEQGHDSPELETLRASLIGS